MAQQFKKNKSLADEELYRKSIERYRSAITKVLENNMNQTADAYAKVIAEGIKGITSDKKLQKKILNIMFERTGEFIEKTDKVIQDVKNGKMTVPGGEEKIARIQESTRRLINSDIKMECPEITDWEEVRKSCDVAIVAGVVAGAATMVVSESLSALGFFAAFEIGGKIVEISYDMEKALSLSTGLLGFGLVSTLSTPIINPKPWKQTSLTAQETLYRSICDKLELEKLDLNIKPKKNNKLIFF